MFSSRHRHIEGAHDRRAGRAVVVVVVKDHRGGADAGRLRRAAGRHGTSVDIAIDDIANTDVVHVGKPSRAGHGSFVDERTIATAQVLDEELGAHPHDLGVIAADGAGIDNDVAVGMPAKHSFFLVQGDLLAGRLASFCSGEDFQFRHGIPCSWFQPLHPIASESDSLRSSRRARRDLTPIWPGRTLAQARLARLACPGPAGG